MRPTEAQEISTTEAQHFKLQTLTRLLRSLGAIVLVASAVAFLLQQWVGLDSVYRYYSFLGFTLLLVAAGVFCGIRLKEAKGARTFLGIAAVFLPAHFAQLGALIYSLFIKNHQTLFSDQNPYVRTLAIYQAPSAVIALLTVAIALVCLVPITFAGISSMARARARLLTGVYLAGNALFLLPTRNPDLMSLLLLAAFVGCSAIDLRVFSRSVPMQTWEGRAVRVMMFTPLLVLFGRSLLLYPTTALVYSALFAIAAVLLFVVFPALIVEDEPKQFFQVLSVVPMSLAWKNFLEGVVYNDRIGIFNWLVNAVAGQSEIVFFWLPVAAIMALMSMYAVGGGRSYRRNAAGIAIISVLAQLFVGDGVFASVLCVTTAVVVIVSAFSMEERALLILGSVGLFLGLGYHLRFAIDLLTMSTWVSLWVIGSATIISASYLERNYQQVVFGIQGFRQRLEAWS